VIPFAECFIEVRAVGRFWRGGPQAGNQPLVAHSTIRIGDGHGHRATNRDSTGYLSAADQSGHTSPAGHRGPIVYNPRSVSLTEGVNRR